MIAVGTEYDRCGNGGKLVGTSFKVSNVIESKKYFKIYILVFIINKVINDNTLNIQANKMKYKVDVYN